MKKILLFIVAVFFFLTCEKENIIKMVDEEPHTQSTIVDSRGAEKVDVCHNGHIINVSVNSLPAHQAHDDAIDMDGDGYFNKVNVCGLNEMEACDNDADINPGVEEICDGIDNNCDGVVDEGCVVEVVLLDEDFESYAAGTFPGSGGWVLRYRGLGQQYQIVTAQEAVSGNQSLKLEGTGGNAALAYHTFNFPATVEEVFLESNINTKIECWCVPNNWYGYAAFNLGNANYTWDHARLLFRQDNQLWLWRGGPVSYLNYDFVASQWYNVRIKYNRTSKLAWVWIDDILIASEINLTPSQALAPLLSAVLVSENGGHTTTYFDDVKVWYEM